jgi:hypothetical protein
MRTPIVSSLSIAAAFSAMFVQGAPTTRRSSAPAREYAKDFPDVILPQVDFGSRSLDEWIELLDASQPSTRRSALWCIYYWHRAAGQTPSRKTTDAIKSLLRICGSTTVPSIGEIQTIWNEWGLLPWWDPVEQRSTRPQDLQNPRADDELLRLLDSPADYVRRRASLELLANRHETKRAYGTFLVSMMRLLPSDVGAMSTATWFAASAARPILDNVLVDLLESKVHDSAWKLALLDQTVFSRNADVERVVRVFDSFDLRDANHRSAILKNLEWMGGYHDRDDFRGTFETSYSWDFHFHQPDPETRTLAPALDRAMQSMLPRLLQQGLTATNLEVPELTRIGAVSLRSEACRRAIAPILKSMLGHPGPLSDRALWLLCHFGDDDPEIRLRYVAMLDGITDFDRVDWNEIPCLTHHDASTLAAFERVYRNAKNKGGFFFKLASAHMLDDKTSWVARDFASHADGKSIYCWCSMMSFPWSVTWGSCDDERMAVRVMKLALTARTKKERGEDASREIAELRTIHRAGTGAMNCAGGCSDHYEQVLAVLPWLDLDDHEYRAQCFRVLMDESPFSFPTHKNWIVSYLSSRGTTDEEKAFIVATHDPFGEEPYMTALASLGPMALPRVHKLRRLAYGIEDQHGLGWNLQALDAVLQIARMSRDDERMLLMVLRDGTCSEALDAVTILKTRPVDSPALRFAARQTIADPDPLVAKAGAELVRARNW